MMLKSLINGWKTMKNEDNGNRLNTLFYTLSKHSALKHLFNDSLFLEKQMGHLL